MSTFERINPFLAYIVGIGLGAEISRSIYTEGGSLTVTAASSLVATLLIIAGEITHRRKKREKQS